MKSWNEIKEAILSASDVLLITHINPDGDAIGSTLALALALQTLGKNVACVCDGKIMEKYTFLGRMGALGKPEEQQERAFGLAIAIDCAGREPALGQGGEALRQGPARTSTSTTHNTNIRLRAFKRSGKRILQRRAYL